MFKKLALLLFIPMVFGCSSNDSSETNTPENRPSTIKRIIEEIPSYGVRDVFNFNYEGDILRSVSIGTILFNFIYEGNKIIKSEYYVNSVLSNSSIINYDADKLKSITSDANNSKTEYTYEQNDLKEQISYFKNEQNEWSFREKNVFTYRNGNTIETKTLSSISNRIIYSYDTKNHPMDNMNPYLRFLLPIRGIYLHNRNNVVEYELYYTEESPIPFRTNHYEITYNENNYPVKIEEFYDSDTTSPITITSIEYN